MAGQERAAAVRRVVAPNPGPLTGRGTNTWIVGTGDVAVIDPGPADCPEHVAAVLGALAPGERVAAILLTHPHADHAGAVPALVAATGAPVAAHGGVIGGVTGGGQGLRDRAGLEHPAPRLTPDRTLTEGDMVTVGAVRLAVLHTPGHHPAHLAFRADELAFTGDTVMGWASTLIDPPEGDLADYRRTVARLRDLGAARFLPGHGEPVAAPALRCAALLDHRAAREAAVLAALAAGVTAMPDLVARVYADTPPALHPAAARNLLAHLLDLAARGVVVGPANALVAPGPWRIADHA